MRFVVVFEELSHAYRIQDTRWILLAQEDDMPVRLYFRNKAQPQAICDIMNEEWTAFLKSPY